jgi:hypothetical protein
VQPSTPRAAERVISPPHHSASPANDERKPSIVTIKRKSRFGDAPDLTPEELRGAARLPMPCGADWWVGRPPRIGRDQPAEGGGMWRDLGRRCGGVINSRNSGLKAVASDYRQPISLMTDGIGLA